MPKLRGEKPCSPRNASTVNEGENMAVNELTLPTWKVLDEKRQRFIAEQLTRYFLSPLLTVDES